MMKNKLSIFIILAFMVSVPQTCFAINDVEDNSQEVVLIEDVEYTNEIHSEFSLEDCIKIALKNNLGIQSSVINEAIYKAKIGQAWSNYFPQLTAGVDWAKNKDRMFGTYNSSYLPQVSANMLIFDFGKTKAMADSAKRTYESKSLDTQENINLLICNIKKAYYNLLFAQAQYYVYIDTVDDFALQKKRAESLYKAGKKAKVDVAIADYNLCKAELNFEKAKNILKVAKMELSRIMGFPEYINYDLTSELGQETYDINIENALAKAYEVRPELLSVQKVTEAAKMDLRSRKRDFTPNLSVNASYGNALGTYDTYSYGFGVNLNYSNFNIMKTKKIIDEANATYKKKMVDLEDTKQSLYLSVKKSYENLLTAQQTIYIAEKALEQAKEQYRQTSGRYNAGIADIIELKDGENAYLNARLDYYNSLLTYNISVAEFEKEVGIPILGIANKKSDSEMLDK